MYRAVLEWLLKNKTIVLIFVLALIVRLLLILFIPYPFYPKKVDDAHMYDVLATNLMEGRGFSFDEKAPYRATIWRTPIYPFFLVGIFSVSGHNYNLVRIVHALLDSTTCLMLYYIFLLGFKNGGKYKRPATIAYLLAALCPFTAFFTSMLYTEILLNFLYTLSILLFLLAINKGKKIYYIFSGIAIALTFLCRPALSMYPFLLVICMFLTNIRTNWGILFKNIIIYFFAIFLIWSPWIYRNYVTFKRFIPLSVAVGTYIWLGTYPANRYDKDLPVDQKLLDEYMDMEGIEVLDKDARWGREGIEKIKKAPLQYIYYCGQRALVLMFSSYSHYVQIDQTFPEIIDGVKSARSMAESARFTAILLVKLFLTVLNIAFILFGFLGMILAFRFWKTIYPILLAPIYIILVQVPLGYIHARYFVPAWPTLLIFTGYGLWWLISVKRERGAF